MLGISNLTAWIEIMVLLIEVVVIIILVSHFRSIDDHSEVLEEYRTTRGPYGKNGQAHIRGGGPHRDRGEQRGQAIFPNL